MSGPARIPCQPWWPGVAAALAITACCGGAPTHECNFMPVRPEAGPVDAGEEAPPGSIQCGEITCVPGESCCVTEHSSTCSDRIAMCMGILAECDGNEDCESGLRCCVIPAFGQATCRVPKLCPGSGVFKDGTAILCHRDADCPPEHQSCTPVQVQAGQFKVCM